MPAKINCREEEKWGNLSIHRIADARAPPMVGLSKKLDVQSLTRRRYPVGFCRALTWLQVGAQPTDPSEPFWLYGCIVRRHLLRGVEKGAIHR
jgi:hypothetical protein